MTIHAPKVFATYIEIDKIMVDIAKSFSMAENFEIIKK